jgi:nucleotide-binding universal stress UspA family protein
MDALKPALDRIVVGMDFGTPSMEATRWVAQTFAPGSELILVHALDRRPPATDASSASPPMGHEDSQTAARRLHELARAFAAEGSYRVEVRDDGPAQAILAVATDVGADLVVVGPHGGREAPRGIGTTAERLIRTSPVPVLLVNHPRPRRPEVLLVPVDGGDLTRLVLEWTDFLATRAGVRVTLLHVLDPGLPDRASSDVVRDEQWLTSLAAESPRLQRTTSLTTTGKPAGEILDAASRLGADLIVMGRRGQRRVLSGVAGSTASDTLRNAACPVLIVVDPPDAVFDDWADGP